MASEPESGLSHALRGMFLILHLEADRHDDLTCEDLATVFRGFPKALGGLGGLQSRVRMAELRDKHIHQNLYLEGPQGNPNRLQATGCTS